MGIFELFRPDTTALTETLGEAAAGVLLAVMRSDGEISHGEKTQFGLVMGNHPIFRDQPSRDFERMVEKITARLNRGEWADYLKDCAMAIPIERRATVFALAVDMAFADASSGEHEDTLISYLAQVLQINDDAYGNIVGVLSIKAGMIIPGT